MQVYFDNAATTPLRDEVVDEIKNCLLETFGNPSSTHSFGRSAKSKLENARKNIALTLNVIEWNSLRLSTKRNKGILFFIANKGCESERVLSWFQILNTTSYRVKCLHMCKISTYCAILKNEI